VHGVVPIPRLSHSGIIDLSVDFDRHDARIVPGYALFIRIVIVVERGSEIHQEARCVAMGHAAVVVVAWHADYRATMLRGHNLSKSSSHRVVRTHPHSPGQNAEVVNLPSQMSVPCTYNTRIAETKVGLLDCIGKTLCPIGTIQLGEETPRIGVYVQRECSNTAKAESVLLLLHRTAGPGSRFALPRIALGQPVLYST